MPTRAGRTMGCAAHRHASTAARAAEPSSRDACRGCVPGNEKVLRVQLCTVCTRSTSLLGVGSYSKVVHAKLYTRVTFRDISHFSCWRKSDTATCGRALAAGWPWRLCSSSLCSQTQRLRPLSYTRTTLTRPWPNTTRSSSTFTPLVRAPPPAHRCMAACV